MDLDELERDVLGEEENVEDNTPMDVVNSLGEKEETLKTPNPVKPAIDVNALAKTIEEQKKELNELKQFKENITGTKPKDPNEIDREKFLEDPFDFYNKKINNKVDEVRREVFNRDISRQVAESTKELEREYEINWGKDQNRINDALNMLDKDMKQSDPKGALRKAFMLAGIKHKDNINTLGFTEMGISQQMQEKKDLDEAQQIKQNILNVKNDALDFI